MKGRMKLAILLLAACGLLPAADPPVVDSTLADGYRAMYNLRFAEAHQDFDRYRKAHPADAMGPVSAAAADLFGEFERLKILQSEFFTHNESFFNLRKPPADPSVKRRFDETLASARQLSTARLRLEPQDPDALLADTIRLGLSASFLSLIEKRSLDALKQVKESRAVAARLLLARPDYYDAHLAAGVENYLLSQKAAPVRWVLNMAGAHTDLDTGIEELKITAEKGHYLLPYARLLLAVADLRAKDPASARARLEWLAGEFPGNPLYRLEADRLR